VGAPGQLGAAADDAGGRRGRARPGAARVRALLVGQAPSRSSEGRPAFDGRSGRRIAELMGTPALALPAVNLIEEWPGPGAGKGDAFPMHRARRGAASPRASLGALGDVPDLPGRRGRAGRGGGAVRARGRAAALLGRGGGPRG
jgi:hypothetical protein